jgi:pantetheine-phosphate adenylyltransferase
MRKAAYAGSFDPITLGHANIVERVAPLYDELIVLIAEDHRKTYMFSAQERVHMAKEVLGHISNVTLVICKDQYAATLAKSLGANVLVRGIRNVKDLDEESVLAEENRNICPEIETAWIPCLPTLMSVSSTVVKSHIGTDPAWEKQVARLVPRIILEKIKEKYMLNRAKKHWNTLMADLGNPKDSGRIFEGLVASYGETWRFYHTLSHIVSMLDELEEVKEKVENLSALKLAIWYHDVVYETEGNDHVLGNNETRSAYRAGHDMRELELSEDLILLVERSITTTTHEEPTHYPDTKFLLDLDLAILGKSENEFDEYEANIRKEYAWVPENTFRTGRPKILRSLLARNFIYSTEFFRERYEEAAQKNLKRSIENLSR